MHTDDSDQHEEHDESEEVIDEAVGVGDVVYAALDHTSDTLETMTHLVNELIAQGVVMIAG